MCLAKGLIKPGVGRLRPWNGHFGIQTAIILDTEEMFLKRDKMLALFMQTENFVYVLFRIIAYKTI